MGVWANAMAEVVLLVVKVEFADTGCMCSLLAQYLDPYLATIETYGLISSFLMTQDALHVALLTRVVVLLLGSTPDFPTEYNHPSAIGHFSSTNTVATLVWPGGGNLL